MKLIKDILHRAGLTQIHGAVDIACSSICSSSSQVTKGAMFVAIRGTQTDGHNYILQAITNGAVAVVCEEFPEKIPESVTFIKVKNSSVALGQIASNFYDNPSSRLKLIGVTGTNGKTTVATLLFHLFRELGYKAGLISTVCIRINDEVIPATHTTPDAVRINELLHEMIVRGCRFCFMEVSSHAIVQNRIAGLEFTGGIFTNLSQDHLDYHQTFDQYLKAKKGFFDALPLSAFALINADDRHGRIMVQNTRARVYTYSMETYADFRCHILENQLSGLHLKFEEMEVWFKLVGVFNAYNLLAVYATAVLLGEDKARILANLSTLSAVEGRFDYFITPGNITAIVDYAHTPDAIKNVLQTINTVRRGKGQVIIVLGAGGDRDKTKRPLMAQIASELSHRVILTSDNPRSEDPEQIIADMKKGVDKANIRKVLSIVNRRDAISTACALARPGDIILVAGKGHEKYQEIKGTKYPFDDKAVLREILLGEEQK